MFLNITDGGLDKYFGPPQPLFDAVMGIRSIAGKNQRITPESYLFSQFHCLHDMSSSIMSDERVSDDGLPMPSLWMGYFQFLLTLKNPRNFARTYFSAPQPFSFLSEGNLNTITILDIVDPDGEYSPTFSRNFAECNLRLLQAVYSKIRPLFLASESERSLMTRSLSQAIWKIKQSENRNETGEEFDMPFHHPVIQGRSFMFT
jgi:hypothetical protein